MDNHHGHPNRCVLCERTKLKRVFRRHEQHCDDGDECLSVYEIRWEA
jgi:hypothetical protein